MYKLKRPKKQNPGKCVCGHPCLGGEFLPTGSRQRCPLASVRQAELFWDGAEHQKWGAKAARHPLPRTLSAGAGLLTTAADDGESWFSVWKDSKRMRRARKVGKELERQSTKKGPQRLKRFLTPSVL